MEISVRTDSMSTFGANKNSRMTQKTFGKYLFSIFEMILWYIWILDVVSEGIDYKYEYFSIVNPLSEADIQKYRKMQKYK